MIWSLEQLQLPEATPILDVSLLDLFRVQAISLQQIAYVGSAAIIWLYEYKKPAERSLGHVGAEK